MKAYNLWIMDGHELFVMRADATGILHAVEQAKAAHPDGEITKVEFALPKKEENKGGTVS